MPSERGTAVATAATRRGRSMRLRLFTLIAAVVLPAAIAFSLLILDLYRHERAARERQLLSTARATASAVDADLGRGWALLEALAKSDEMAAGDWAGLDREARRIVPPQMAFVLATPGRGELINTRLEPDAILPTDALPGAEARWEHLKREERVVSGVFVGRTVPKPTLSLDMLVRRRGAPTYVLSLMMDPAIQQHLLATQHLPPGWVAGLLDSQGISIARSPYLPGRVGRPGTPDMVARIRRGEEGVTESVSLTGTRMVAAYARTPNSGWTAIVAAPRAEFEEGAARSLGLALALSLLFLVGGVLLALGLSRRLLFAMDALEAQAEAVGGGRPSAPVSTGLIETDRVSEALAHAASERLKHEQDLAALNANLETRVAEATDQLVQAQKMEALGQLTGGLAHDFNNLLTAVLGNLALLRRTALNERQEKLADNAQSAGERGARLTAQLLAFSRRQRLTPEAIDLNALVEEMRDLLATTLGSAVRITVAEIHGRPIALADRTQLELAILNLAINARDAMPGGGELGVCVSEQVVAAATDQDGAPPPGRYGAVSMRDSGAGMSAEVRRRVFEPFFTTKGPGRGSGLGLSQALGMARQLGGGILVESQPGEGATMTLLLPLADIAGEVSSGAPRTTLANDALGGLHVLLVDDDDAVRTATAEMLSVLGCLVSEAGDAAGALAALPADADLVVADFAMPGMNGAELAQELRRLRPTLPVLLITGYADPQRVEALWRGPVLGKPFSLDALADAVVSTLAQHAAQEA